ncbi:MAG TPA: hypothetical protein VGT44_04390 [Ktedonobacteraceae bacterium]|nr:hypothetical protein [Ktedonobacteraceae bacterium]
MNSKEITDLIIGFQAIVTFFISMRAFYLYFKSHRDILFIVGLSMAVIFLGGIAGVIGDYLITSTAFNTFWFRYIGQIVSYTFIFLISLPGAERFMRLLKWLNIIASFVMLSLLAFTPLLPPIPGVELTEILSGARGVACLAVFFNYYAVLYGMKGTRFSRLMCIAFLLITVGIAIYSLKFSVANPLPYDYVGDSIRAVGLVLMLAAFFVG